MHGRLAGGGCIWSWKSESVCLKEPKLSGEWLKLAAESNISAGVCKFKSKEFENAGAGDERFQLETLILGYIWGKWGLFGLVGSPPLIWQPDEIRVLIKSLLVRSLRSESLLLLFFTWFVEGKWWKSWFVDEGLFKICVNLGKDEISSLIFPACGSCRDWVKKVPVFTAPLHWNPKSWSIEELFVFFCPQSDLLGNEANPLNILGL